MSKSDAFENDFLKLIFNGTSISGLADNASSSPNTNLYVSLHTANPGDAGNQETSEATYTGYARVAVARPAGWLVTDNSVSPAADVEFPECTGGSNTITHFAVGTDATGAGKILYHGTAAPNISVTEGVTPKLKKESTITED